MRCTICDSRVDPATAILYTIGRTDHHICVRCKRRIHAEASGRLAKFQPDPHDQFFPGGIIPKR